MAPIAEATPTARAGTILLAALWLGAPGVATAEWEAEATGLEAG
jgi:hypothetical protein